MKKTSAQSIPALDIAARHRGSAARKDRYPWLSA